MKNSLLALVLCAALASPALAQKTKVKTKGGAAATELPFSARRLQPLFGGLTPEAAQQLLGEPFINGIAQSFASRAEASRFFTNKGYEYLTEGQPDTARYRFNLAWVLDPQNSHAYRGLGILTSATSLDESIGLFARGLAAAPGNSQLLSDLGASYLLRHEQTKKAKDLKLAQQHLDQAVAADANNAYAYQQLARVYYLQGSYPQAWEAVHKARNLSLSNVDFGLVSELTAKLADPQGVFK
ncbi:tetratricopeptide repeat protein [Hymenobacter sp. B81]|uniref:tetratricopeptide repeat protein n=1 Tax=Hymenobacter sp. B81 TaxID=3344878 RepID=UPI0037DDCA01